MGSCDAGSSPRLVLSMEDTKLKRESFYWYWLLFLETSKKKEKRAPSLSQHNLNIHRLDLTTTLAPGHRSDPLYSSLFLLLLRTYVLSFSYLRVDPSYFDQF